MRKSLLIVSLVALALGAYAAAEPAGVSVGGFLSYWDADDADDPALGLGAKGGFEVMPNVVAEARVSMYQFESKEEGDKMTLDVMPLEVGAVYQLPLADTISVFAGGGVGYYVTSLDADLDIEDDLPGAVDFDAESDNAFGYYLIGGGSFQLAENISIFADLKYTFLEVDVTLEADIVGMGHVKESDTANLDGLAIEGGAAIKF